MKVKLLAVLLGLGFLWSCGDDDGEAVLAPPAERILGEWTINSASILGLEINQEMGDMTFQACSSGNIDCPGFFVIIGENNEDDITYTLNSQGTELVIVDEDQDDSDDFSGTWTIQEFTNSTLKISINSILGEVSYTMVK